MGVGYLAGAVYIGTALLSMTTIAWSEALVEWNFVRKGR
jgi:hypothetical protein